MIDDSTILYDADLEWHRQDRKPIYEKMFEVSGARNSKERRKALDELINQYTSPTHTRIYLRQLIEKTTSPDEFFDILEYFAPTTTGDKAAISETMVKILLRSARRKSRNSAETFSPSSFTDFARRIADCKNEYVQDRYEEFLSDSLKRGKLSLDPNKYEVSDELRKLISAFDIDHSNQAGF